MADGAKKAVDTLQRCGVVSLGVITSTVGLHSRGNYVLHVIPIGRTNLRCLRQLLGAYDLSELDQFQKATSC